MLIIITLFSCLRNQYIAAQLTKWLGKLKFAKCKFLDVKINTARSRLLDATSYNENWHGS